MRALIFGMGLLLALAGSVAAQPPAPAFNYAPVPPPRYEAPPPPPGAQYIWRPGHWRWTGQGYAWIPGRYLVRQHAWHGWAPGHWVVRGGVWVWVQPHWR